MNLWNFLKIFKHHKQSPHEPNEPGGFRFGFKVKFGGGKPPLPPPKDYLDEAVENIRKNQEADKEYDRKIEIDKKIEEAEKQIKEANEFIRDDITVVMPPDPARSIRG